MSFFCFFKRVFTVFIIGGLLVACDGSPNMVAGAGDDESRIRDTSPVGVSGKSLSLMGYEYRPSVPVEISSGGVIEVAANQCYIHRAKGGTVELYLHNPNTESVSIDSLLLNGLAVDDLILKSGDTFRDVCNPIQPLSWWSIDNKTVAPDGVATVVLNGDLFLANLPQTFDIVSTPNSASLTGAQVPLADTASNVTDLYFDVEQNRVRLYLAPAGGELINGVKVNGKSVDWSGADSLNIGAPTLLTLNTELTLGAPFIVQVDVEGNRPVMTQRRVVKDAFNNGIGITHVSDRDLDVIRDTGFNSVTAFNHTEEPDYAFLDRVVNYAEQNDIGVVMYGAHSPEKRMEVLARYHDHNGVIALEAIDEPDLPAIPATGFGIHFSTPVRTQQLVEQAQSIDKTKPAVINLQFIGAINMFGPIGDVNGWDHYPFTLDATNLRFEGAAWYADAFRAVRGAKPFWVWPSAYLDPGRLNGGYDPNLAPRWPSPADTRAYNWMSIGHGAKGVRWFIYGNEEGTTGSPTWPEVEFEAALFNVIGDDLVQGTVWLEGANAGLRGLGVDLATVVTPDSAYLTVANLLYDNHTDPTIWIEQQGLAVDWTMPPWLVGKDLAVALIQNETIIPVGTVDDVITVTSDLHHADMFVAMPQEKLDRLIAAISAFAANR